MPSRVASRVYGTVSAHQLKVMSGLKTVQELMDGTFAPQLNRSARAMT
jgi:glutamate-1-semialdehyde aminotransferase